MISFLANQPYNQLPLLPPSREQIESVVILRQESRAMRALAELKGLTRLLPNPAILVDALVLKEAKASSEIENIITTSDRLYQALATNELAFALTKVRVKVNRNEITKHLSDFYLLDPVLVTLEHVQRAAQIAYKVSFSHMSDCVHTAVAEEFCNGLYTYNRSDFQLIEHHTKL